MKPREIATPGLVFHPVCLEPNKKTRIFNAKYTPPMTLQRDASTASHVYSSVSSTPEISILSIPSRPSVITNSQTAPSVWTAFQHGNWLKFALATTQSHEALMGLVTNTTSRPRLDILQSDMSDAICNLATKYIMHMNKGIQT